MFSKIAKDTRYILWQKCRFVRSSCSDKGTWLVKWSLQTAGDHKDVTFNGVQENQSSEIWCTLKRTFPYTCISIFFLSFFFPQLSWCQHWVLFLWSTHARWCNIGGVKREMCSLFCSQPVVICNPFLLSLHLCICTFVSSSSSFLCCKLPCRNFVYLLSIFKKK